MFQTDIIELDFLKKKTKTKTKKNGHSTNVDRSSLAFTLI